MGQIVQNGQNKKYIEQVFFYLYRATQIFPVCFHTKGRHKFTCGHGQLTAFQGGS
jgi:hypothetical protein